MQDEPAYARSALAAGALGYVLEEAATRAHRGGSCGRQGRDVPGTRGSAQGRGRATAGPPDGLSEREFEILKLLALGHTNAQVAQELYLFVELSRAHRSHIQQKLGLRDRAEIVRYALDKRLVYSGSRGSSGAPGRG